MVFNRDRAFAMTKESKKGQEPEQMNRYTANVTEKAEETRGRGYLNTRRNPRRKRKEPLWIRICSYMICWPGVPELPGSGPWRKTRHSGVMNPAM